MQRTREQIELREEEKRARADIVQWVYRLFLYGKCSLIDKDGNVVKNVGMLKGAADACARLKEVLRKQRELKGD